MKYAALILTLCTLVANGQVSQDFDSGSRNAERANCWQFWGTQISGSSKISGSHSARTDKLENNSVKQVISPWISFNGTGNLTFSHKLDNGTSSNKQLQVVRIDDQGNQTTIYTYDYANGGSTQSEVLAVNFSGVYQIAWNFSGDGGNYRGILDNIVLPGTNAADPSNNPSSLGNCAAIQQIVDADGDGVADADDEYPNDPSLAYNVYYPGDANTYGTLAFEDLWPAKGDYDFNDLVVDYQLKMPTSATGTLTQIQVNVRVRAMSGFHKGFALQIIGLDGSNVASVSGNQIAGGSGLSFAANGLEASQTFPTVVLFSNTNDLLTWPGGASYFNTDPQDAPGTPVSFTTTVSLTNGINVLTFMSTSALNPFMFAATDRSKEVHLPGAPPTDLANPLLFGTVDDDTNPGAQKFYKTANNLPWALNLPVQFDHPVEKADMLDAYLRFAQWAQSGGTTASDWYVDQPSNRDDTKVY